MGFQKGISGNPGGRGKGTPWRDAIERAVSRRSKKKDLKGVDDAADALLDATIAGDISAMREMGDRLDGKAYQSVGLAGHDGGAIHVKSAPDLSNLTNAQLAALEAIAVATRSGKDQSRKSKA